MKYGMRERISGGIILVAIAVILVLFFCGRPGHHNENAAVPDVSFNQQPVNNGVANDQPLTLPADASATPNAAAPGAVAGTATTTGAITNGAVTASGTDTALPAVNQQNSNAAVNPQPAAPQYQPQQPAPVAPIAVQPAPVQPAPQRPAANVAPARPAPAVVAPAPVPSKPVATAQPAHKPAADAKPAKLASTDPIINAAQRNDARPAPAPAPAAKPAAPVAPAAVPADGWSVQAGSFGNNDNAERLIQRLSQNGFKAYTLKRDPNTVVLVGPFSTSQAAEEARTQMQQRAGTNGLVVRNGKH